MTDSSASPSRLHCGSATGPDRQSRHGEHSPAPPRLPPASGQMAQVPRPPLRERRPAASATVRQRGRGRARGSPQSGARRDPVRRSARAAPPQPATAPSRQPGQDAGPHRPGRWNRLPSPARHRHVHTNSPAPALPARSEPPQYAQPPKGWAGCGLYCAQAVPERRASSASAWPRASASACRARRSASCCARRARSVSLSGSSAGNPV